MDEKSNDYRYLLAGLAMNAILIRTNHCYDPAEIAVEALDMAEAVFSEVARRVFIRHLEEERIKNVPDVQAV